jgi:peptidoglycan hydrolase CwlO-like protein
LSKELVDRLSNLENQNQNLNNVVQEKETVVVQNQKETEDLSSKVSQLTDESSTLKRRLEKSEEEFSEQLRSKNRLIEDLEYSKSSAYRRITSLGK